LRGRCQNRHQRHDTNGLTRSHRTRRPNDEPNRGLRKHHAPTLSPVMTDTPPSHPDEFPPIALDPTPPG
jgi:hypothetical protein